MKQSISLVILQILSIILGIFSAFYIAANLSPKIYSILGVQGVINSLVLVFSNTGLEVYAIRNVLHWKEKGKNNIINELISHAVIARTILAILLQLPLFFYYYYISCIKFNNHYLSLFFIFGIFAIPRAILDSLNLILKSFNRYFIAILTSYSVTIFGRIIALILFTKYNFKIYILTLITIPVVILIPIFFILKKYINLNYLFNYYDLKKNLKNSWKFGVASYTSFPFNYLDSLIISIFVSPEFFGSFAIGKRIYTISKQFIENIFDPLIQKLVKYKTDLEKLKNKFNKIILIQKILIIISIIILILFYFYLKKILFYLNINKYPYIYNFILIINISQIIYMILKVKFDFIILFYSSSNYLKLNLINSIFSIIFLLIFLQISIKWIFFYILFTNLILLIYTQYLYNKKNIEL